MPVHDRTAPAPLPGLAAALFVLALTAAPRPAAAEAPPTRGPVYDIVAATAPKPGADEPLLLEVVINGYPTGKIGQFVRREGALFSTRDELRQLGLRVPARVHAAPGGLVALADLPGLAARFDQPKQTLYITAPLSSLLSTLLRPGAAPVGVAAESGIGATLDYDADGTSAGGRMAASGAFDLRGFSPWGVLSSGLLAYGGAGAGIGPAVRLDTTYVYSDPLTLRRYRLGDFVTGGLGWTRPVRFGGAQVNLDFSMRPDLVTFPLPSVAGAAAVPSTVDVLVNGTRILSRQVEPGPFQVPQLPVVTGAGTVSMTVTDALGHQIATTLPFYASSALLARGLQTYSAELGMVRRNWGLISNDYGDPAGEASYRRGLTDAVTLEAHAEGTAGQVMAGAGAVVNLANLAVLNLAAAASTASGRTGGQVAVGAQRIGRTFSIGASATVADSNYRDVAAMNGDPVIRLQINANAGLSLGRSGSIGVAYTSIDRASTPAPTALLAAPGTVSSGAAPVLVQPAERAQLLSASYSVEVRDIAFYATGFHDFARGGGGSGALVGVTIPLGPRSSASIGATAGSGGVSGEAQASQTVVSIGDWGYQLYGASGRPSHEFDDVQYKSRWALLSGGVDRTAGQTTLRAEARGALSFVDGGLFASNTIADSFAVVDTNGLGNVEVFEENRSVGKTDAAGRLLVPDLRSFDVNHISINPTDVPADTSMQSAAREVRPQDRSGVVVNFQLRRSHGALLRLQLDGKPVPAGSTATLRSTGAVAPVGYGGETYFEDLRPHDTVVVELPNGKRCVASFDYRAAPGDIPAIGPLPCREASP